MLDGRGDPQPGFSSGRMPNRKHFSRFVVKILVNIQDDFVVPTKLHPVLFDHGSDIEFEFLRNERPARIPISVVLKPEASLNRSRFAEYRRAHEKLELVFFATSAITDVDSEFAAFEGSVLEHKLIKLETFWFFVADDDRNEVSSSDTDPVVFSGN